MTGIFPNPPIRSEAFTFDINSNVFEGLVRRDRSLRLEPALAERWESLDDDPVPPVGTGPFLLESWTPGRELVLRRNGFYRGPAPAFERVRLLVRPDPGERVRALLLGEAQLADHVPLTEIDRLERFSEIRVVSRSGLFVLFLAFRMDAPPFADPAVREAVDLALDRDELVRHALRGRAAVATQLVPPAVAGYNPDIRATRPDRPRARALLARAGGFSVTLDGTNDRYFNDVDVLHEVARQLGDVGLQVAVRSMSKRDFEKRLGSGQARFYMLGWSCDALHAGDALNGLIHSQPKGPPGNQNYQGLSDPELDRLIEEADRAADAWQRNELHARALARVAALRAVVPLVVQPETIAFARTLGWEPPLNFILRFAEMKPVERP